jgi:hypothetical protein
MASISLGTASLDACPRLKRDRNVQSRSLNAFMLIEKRVEGELKLVDKDEA